MSNASNQNGRCMDSSVWITRDADANAVGDTFRQAVGNFPVVGSFVAGLVPDTLTMNAIRSCPGATIDHTTGYRQTYGLMALTVMLLVIYIIIPKK
jgi:hypothetical protein